MRFYKEAAPDGALGFGNLTGVHDALGGRFDFGALRVFRAARGRETRTTVTQSR